MARKKICFVVQRYGLEVNGGAELLCRQLAERMTDRYEVHVFTSKAVDYNTWANVYPQEQESINGVTVHRFAVEHPRRAARFNHINAMFYAGELHPGYEEDAWFEAEGPYTPALITALDAARDTYSAFIFFTYLYYTSVYGLPVVREKAIFVPTAHDEPFLVMDRVHRVFAAPRAYFYMTADEQKLVEERFHTASIPSAIGGAGVTLPEGIDGARFREKYHLDGDYIIYVGRIDEGKNCDEMFRYWQAYKERSPGPLKLVMMGKEMIPVPAREDLVSLGFVSDRDKFDGIAAAKFLLLPSKFESLSIVVLEAFSLKVPVLVNGACPVLKSHCTESGAGLYYTNFMEFEGAVNALLRKPDLYAALSQNGPAYVDQHYQWSVITGKLAGLIEGI